MKLEPNMYVRIQWGNGEQTISKCTIKIDIGDTQYSNNDFYIHTDKKGEVVYKSMIVKASHNIIDLIEVGDYVNGYKISAIYDDDSEVNEYNLKHKKCLGKNIYDEDYQEYLIYEEDIKSIVTKEMYSSVEYRVETN